ncbi:hypothetical protein ONZ45_g4091 [Pleurotus djamor]|nr:hypothetical protein ONZ45_g4091 [Pleurotus djamor]
MFLGNKGLQPKTIKSYLSAVRSLHVDADVPFTSCESPMVQRVIRGIRRYQGERSRNPKQPITIEILRKIALNDPTSHELIVFQAAAKLAFAGFLRCGEFTVAKANSFDPSVHLTRASVDFQPSFDDAAFIIVTLPSSKTDPFRKGVPLYIAAAPGTSTCPVSALQQLFKSDPRPPNSPLFVSSDGLPLTRDNFIARLKLSLLLAGCDPSGFSGHSFRRGAASSAAAAGYPDHLIQQLGRWRSDAYKLYIDTPRDQLLNMSFQLHWASLPPRHPAPTDLRLVPSLA